MDFPIPDGIWLGLPLTDYLADEALGASDLKALLTNAVQWHARERNAVWRELHPPSEKETAASIFGSALHCAILEPEVFEARYYVQPEAPDLPRTKEEINAELAAMGLPTLSTSKKSVLFEAAAAAAEIETLAAWRDTQAAESAGREPISPAWHRALLLLQSVLEHHSEAPKFIRNGRAEISIFWTDATGLRLKIRIDYLRVRTVCDIKSYALREAEEPISAFCSTVERFGYDFSAAHYMDGRLNALPGLAEAGRIYKGAPSRGDDGSIYAEPAGAKDFAFFAQVAGELEPSWAWLACMTQGYPEVDAIVFPGSLMQFGSAKVQLDQARETYRNMAAKFDAGAPWIVDRGLVYATDHCFRSARARDRGAVLWETVG